MVYIGNISSVDHVKCSCPWRSRRVKFWYVLSSGSLGNSGSRWTRHCTWSTTLSPHCREWFTCAVDTRRTSLQASHPVCIRLWYILNIRSQNTAWTGTDMHWHIVHVSRMGESIDTLMSNGYSIWLGAFRGSTYRWNGTLSATHLVNKTPLLCGVTTLL